MAVPKKRQSIQRRKIRRATLRVTELSTGKCTNCGDATINFNACNSCGQYKGRTYKAVS